jgi:hypothetical protein
MAPLWLDNTASGRTKALEGNLSQSDWVAKSNRAFRGRVTGITDAGAGAAAGGKSVGPCRIG